MQTRDVDVARRRREGVARQIPDRCPELILPAMGEREGVAALADTGEVGGPDPAQRGRRR